MSTDEFTKLFNYISERFDKIDAVLVSKTDKSDHQVVVGLLDALAKRQEI
jgi:hypothetical protein